MAVRLYSNQSHSIGRELSMCQDRVGHRGAAESRNLVQLQREDALQDTLYLRDRFADLDHFATQCVARVKEYLAYCDATGIRPDEPAVSAANAAARTLLDRRLAIGEVILDPRLPTTKYARSYTNYWESYRALLNLTLPLALALDWRSASYAQSLDPMFLRPESQGSTGVNYNRYESGDLCALEDRLAKILAFDTDCVALRLTSSGMAAYSLIENFLLRHVLRPGDTVLIPHYIYFESHEQITSLPGITAHVANTHRTHEILRLVRERKPRVLFIDPIENTMSLRMTDIAGVVREMAEMYDEEIYVVIDGTMLPGESAPFAIVAPNRKVKVLYYESCSKYLQLGLDLAMAGFVACSTEHVAAIDRLRRNTGAILYDPAVHVFPTYTRQTHLGRTRRMTRNALVVAEAIRSDLALADQVEVVFPLLPDHPDQNLAKRFHSVGGVLTFRFCSSALNEREALNAFIDVALDVARAREVSITKGVSFGFSLPRLSAAASMAATTRPFLRLSVGDRSIRETLALAGALREAFCRHLSLDY